MKLFSVSLLLVVLVLCDQVMSSRQMSIPEKEMTTPPTQVSLDATDALDSVTRLFYGGYGGGYGCNPCYPSYGLGYGYMPYHHHHIDYHHHGHHW